MKKSFSVFPIDAKVVNSSQKKLYCGRFFNLDIQLFSVFPLVFAQEMKKNL